MNNANGNRRWGGLPRRRSIPHRDTRPEAMEEYMNDLQRDALSCCDCGMEVDGSLFCETCGGSLCEAHSDHPGECLHGKPLPDHGRP